MLKDIFNKSLVTIVTIFLIGSIIIPIVNAQSIEIKESKSDEYSETSDKDLEELLYTNPSKNLFVPGEIIVKFKEKTEITQLSVNNQMSIGINSVDKLNVKYGVLSAERISKESNSLLSNVYKFTVPKDSDIRSIINEYSNDPNVEYVEPNYIVFLNSIPNDPLFNKQWGLHNTGQTGGVVDADIDAPEAWDIATGSSDVTIAVIDSGIDYNHPDLKGNIWRNNDEIAGNGFDDDFNGFIDDVIGWDFIRNTNDPKDDFGHGTHCSGIIGAVGNNGIGVSGVCWDCSIMPVKVFSENGQSSIGVLYRGINYAVDNGAKIISMSWGYSGDSKLIEDALQNAYSKGVVLVASAGNSNSQIPSAPAKFDYVIGVAATDKNNTRAIFSNYGNWVDVAAPGVDVYSTMPTYHVLLNDYDCTPNYSNMSGTSMSAPCVAGVVGLILSKNPGMKQDEIKTLIQSGVSKVNSNKYIGTGNTNLFYCAQNDTVPIVNLDFLLDQIQVEGFFVVKGSAYGDTFQEYSISVGSGIYPDSWDLKWTSNIPVKNNNLYSLDTKSLKDGLYTLKLEVKDIHGKNFKDMLGLLVNNDKTIVYVDDDNNNADYKTISEAANISGNGDTIYVYSGTYPENVFIDKSINLIGENKENTVISGVVVYYDTINVKVTGFTFTGLKVVHQSYDPANYDLQFIYTGPETDAVALLYTFYRLSAIYCGNITISDNIFEKFTAPPLTSEQYIPGVDAYLFEGIGIYLGGCSASQVTNNLIIGNQFDPSKTEKGNSPTVGIDISGSDSTIIENNIILNNSVLEKSDKKSKATGGSLFDLTNESLPSGISENGAFNVIKNNTINNNLKGIYTMMSQYTNINNNILSNNKYAIYTDFLGCMFANIHHNTIENNENGIGLGIGITYNNIYDNIIENNSIGIQTINNLPSLFSSFASLIPTIENKIYHNSIKNNDKGIDINGWTNGTISDNNIENNTKYGLKLINSKNNEIYRNNFIKNGILNLKRKDAICTKGRNKWDNGTAGNYWDNYKGRFFKKLVDLDGDGFGNIPYIVPNRLQFDKHPKLEPYNIII